MMQEVEVLKTIPELVCSYFSEEQFTLSKACFRLFLHRFYAKMEILKLPLNDRWSFPGKYKLWGKTYAGKNGSVDQLGGV